MSTATTRDRPPSGRTTAEVSVLVVSYNTRDLTLACLRSIGEQTVLAHEVIVVDNASADGSAAAIAQQFPDVTLLAETRNHGFGRASNLAARHASGRYLLLLNPDTVVLDGGIDRLVRFADEMPQAGIWGGRTVYADGTLNHTCCFQHMTTWRLLCRALGLTRLLGNHRWVSEQYGGWAMQDARPVDVVTGCFLLISRTLWDRLGGFDPAFFMYGEEADLCLRARQMGAAPHFTPAAQIVHHGGASETVPVDKAVRLFTAKALLIRQHFGRWRGPALVLLHTIPLTRVVVLRAAAALTRRQRLRDAAAHWGQVWARREEWRGGSARRSPSGSG